MGITYGSICSGIEAVSIAWKQLGFTPEWFSQYDPEHNYDKGLDFPSLVLQHQYPNIPNLGDMTLIADYIKLGFVSAPDVLVGGTPCQSYSVAGKRNGLNDDRGLLTLKFVEIVDAIDRQRPAGDECVVVWENVPGVLSSKDNAFGCFLGDLAGEDCELKPAGKKWTNAGCVFGPKRTIAWRILDAQYFGVAQRRRRVFVVASARAGFDPTEILFEREGVRRDTPPSRETKKDPSEGIGSSVNIKGFRMTAFGEYADDDTSSTCKARDYKDATELVVNSVHGTQDPCVYRNIAHTVGRNNGAENAIYCDNVSRTLLAKPNDSLAYDLDTYISECRGVRRLTPVEHERLQGFPDGYTKLTDNTPDGHRYKSLGNSMAVPVMRWIGERIEDAI